MKRNLISVYLYDDEIEMIREIAKDSKWPITECTSFFFRLGTESYDFSKGTINNDIGNALAKTHVRRFLETPAGKIELEKRVKESLKMKDSVNG